jgi:hypothetical protein
MVQRFLSWFGARRLVVAILFVVLFAMAVRVPVDTDTWWHLQAGRVTLEEGHIIRSDPFSHTFYGSPWVAYSWLSEVILYWVFSTFSYAGLALLLASVVTLAFFFVYLQMEGDPFSRAFIVVLAAAVSAVVWIARPHLFSFLLTGVLAYVLYLYKWRQRNLLWILPPLFVLWVNLHAGYAQGFMVLVAFVAGEAFNHLAAFFVPSDDPTLNWRRIGLVIGISVLCFLLLVVHPNTTSMWTYYLDTVRIGALRDYIQEWQSPNFHPLYVQPFIWMLLAILAAMGLSGRRVDGVDLAMVTMVAYASLLAGRFFGPFALLTAPVLSRHVSAALKRFGLARWLRRRPRRQRPLLGMINVAVLAAVVVAGVWKAQAPLSLAFNERQQDENLPVEAAAWIREHRPDGEMFNPYNWGGYLMWVLWPDYRVFVDGRTDLYGDEFLRDYLKIQYARPGYDDLLADHDIGFVVTYRDDVLSTRLACEEGWEKVYEDDGEGGVAVIWVRVK